MEMTLRWYGSRFDSVTLQQIRQIPRDRQQQKESAISSLQRVFNMKSSYRSIRTGTRI